MSKEIKLLWMQSRGNLKAFKKEWTALEFRCDNSHDYNIIGDVLSIIAAEHAIEHATQWTRPSVTKAIAEL